MDDRFSPVRIELATHRTTGPVAAAGGAVFSPVKDDSQVQVAPRIGRIEILEVAFGLGHARPVAQPPAVGLTPLIPPMASSHRRSRFATSVHRKLLHESSGLRAFINDHDERRVNQSALPAVKIEHN